MGSVVAALCHVDPGFLIAHGVQVIQICLPIGIVFGVRNAGAEVCTGRCHEAVQIGVVLLEDLFLGVVPGQIVNQLFRLTGSGVVFLLLV